MRLPGRVLSSVEAEVRTPAQSNWAPHPHPLRLAAGVDVVGVSRHDPSHVSHFPPGLHDFRPAAYMRCLEPCRGALPWSPGFLDRRTMERSLVSSRLTSAARLGAIEGPPRLTGFPVQTKHAGLDTSSKVESRTRGPLAGLFSSPSRQSLPPQCPRTTARRRVSRACFDVSNGWYKTWTSPSEKTLCSTTRTYPTKQPLQSKQHSSSNNNGNNCNNNISTTHSTT
ncbi:hypothetical protein BKA56DRAFT_34115 [Ilyonectria sp. MPI-CAGE-AT-0026]|nr:hypothetical protein BKA56DRAFT_34115 [Ilyonectria sp. MPI-CAGE-AT-0026]